MSDNVENLILEHLRGIRADIGGLKENKKGRLRLRGPF